MKFFRAFCCMYIHTETPDLLPQEQTRGGRGDDDGREGGTTMNARLFGRLLLSLVLVGSAAAVFGFTWNESHVFNPDWHPHARFHAAQIMGIAAAASAVGLWLVWRRSAEPDVVTLAVAAAAVCFWGAEFFAFFIPGTSPSPDFADPNTFSLLGFEVYGNLFFSGVMIALSVLACLVTGAVGGRKREP